jgi:peptidoglycan/xylan/chitin deacetylase (PgdA/CDA1 family)
MKVVKKLLFAVFITGVLAASFYYFWLSPRYTVPILMYHRFGYEKSTLFVTPENFQRQMAYLKEKRYNVISLDALVEGMRAKRKFKHNTVVITVDDGYEDNYTHAYPVLKKERFPATIFIIAEHIGMIKGFLTWEEVKEMLKSGITFGAHTKSDVYVPSLRDEARLWEETAGARRMIEGHINSPVYYFCYPTGGFTEMAKETLKKAGYRAACTTNRGFADFNADLYELKRVKITNSDMNKPFSFWAKLSGYYNLFRSKKRGH